MNILVTGGAGYIGSHFINKTLQQGDCRIVVVDNFSQGRSNIINDPRITYEEVDLVDKVALKKVFTDNNFDIVVHFAALASVPDSVVRPREYYYNNVIGGLNLLDCMLEGGVKKIINSSSASIFGEPITEIITEDHPKLPTNPYGSTKLVIEYILKEYHTAYGIQSVSFRYFCACGCDESLKVGEYHQPETHVIPCIIEALLGKREKFYVYGDDYPTPDGSGIRDYIHVNDLAEVHRLAMEKLLGGVEACEFLNMGIIKGFSVFELIKVAEKISGKKLNYEVRARRLGDPSMLIADSTKAQQWLGWKPKYTSIEEIFESAYNYFKLKK